MKYVKITSIDWDVIKWNIEYPMAKIPNYIIWLQNSTKSIMLCFLPQDVNMMLLCKGYNLDMNGLDD